MRWRGTFNESAAVCVLCMQLDLNQIKANIPSIGLPWILLVSLSARVSHCMSICYASIVCLQSVGSGLSLEPPATTEADEEEDGMSDIIQEVRDLLNLIS